MEGLGPDKDAKNDYRLETERLLIEVPADEDAPTLYELTGGEDRLEITAGLIWDGPDEVSETLEFIGKARSETWGQGGFHWVIRDREGGLTGEPGRAIGMIGARPSNQPGRGDVGYWLGKPYWGKGVMREALTAVLDLCFDDLDMVKIEAEIFTFNQRSLRLVESVGMKQEATIRSAHLKRGEWVDAHIYGILREEWLPGKTSFTSESDM